MNGVSKFQFRLGSSHSQCLHATGNMAVVTSVEEGDVQRHWGELQQPLPKTILLHIDMAEPKAAEYEVPRLHQPSCEHFPPKDE